MRAQERRAYGGGDRARADGSAASITTTFCRRRALVGREGLGQGARDGAAGDRAPWADRGLDYRRHGFPQTGPAFGRGGTAVLWSTRQAGQLSGRGVAIDCQSSRQPAGGLSPLFAGTVGGGR